MGKLIKMIWTSDVNCLFIYGLTANDEIIFRTSYNINQLRKEKMQVHDYVCYFGVYNLDINSLIGLPVLNN